MSNNKLEDIVKRLETVASKLENLPQLNSTGDMNFICSSDNQVTLDFDVIVNSEFKALVDISNKIGGDVATQIQLVSKALNEEKELLKKATVSSKPSDSDFKTIIIPLSESINKIVEFREKNRRSEFFNHLTAISEGIPALGWVTISPTPCPFIKEMQDASMFYTNRVIKEFKEKDASHVEWTKAWMTLLTQLQGFVKKHYITGLSWMGKASATPSIAPKPSKAAGGPPPPPPPPPAAPASNNASDSASHAALFAQINKGNDIACGLRKVTDDQKTHKNPQLRAGNIVSDSDLHKNTGNKTAVTAKAAVSKPPVTKLEGTKWSVEFYNDKKDIVILDTAIKHTLIVYKCNNCVITVKGKINSIMMDSCKKTAIVFDGLISSLDLVNCSSVQAQTLGVLPIVNIDKTDGAQVYLSEESLKAEIISAKSSEMNILIPTPTGDMKEMAVPEQFKTKLVNGKLITSCAEDY